MNLTAVSYMLTWQISVWWLVRGMRHLCRACWQLTNRICRWSPLRRQLISGLQWDLIMAEHQREAGERLITAGWTAIFPIHFVTHRQLKTDTFTPPNFTSKLNAEIINKLMNHCLQVELFQGRTVFPLVCRSEMTKDRYFTPPNSSVYCSPQRQANWIQKLNN